jgi:hypothetical protein
MKLIAIGLNIDGLNPISKIKVFRRPLCAKGRLKTKTLKPTNGFQDFLFGQLAHKKSSTPNRTALLYFEIGNLNISPSPHPPAKPKRQSRLAG